MTKSSKTSTNGTLKPRGRSGGRNPLPENQKKEQICAYLPVGDVLALKMLVPVAAARNLLFKSWVQAYVISNGESDLLLARAPLSAKLAAYLEETNAPQELRDELESLVG